MKRSSAVGAGAVALALLLSCSVVSDPWSYSEITFADMLDELGSGCGACVRAQCASAFEDCERDRSCVDYAACRLASPSPRSYYACGDDRSLHPDYATVTRCQGCDEACQLGAQWSCVGRYSLPAHDDPVVVRTIQLVDNDVIGGRRPFSGVVVRACRKAGLECGRELSEVPDPRSERDLITWTRADELGLATLELPIEPGAAGFDGLFVVSGPEIPTYRIHYTEPLPTSATDMELLSSESLARILESAALPPLGADVVYGLFQVQDCLWQPARDVSVVGIGASLLVHYNEGLFGEPGNISATTLGGAGTGALLGIDPAIGLLTLEFRLGDAVVDRGAITVVPGQISVIQAGAGSSTEVSPL